MENKTENSYRILIVDDSPETLSVIQSALEKENYLVSVAKNGEKAFKIATALLPDLILLDILMPGMNGFDTCKNLKNNEITKNIPVIFLTGVSDTHDKVKGFTLGAEDFLIKPIEIEELLVRVRTHLSIHTLKKELLNANKNLEERVALRTRELTELNQQLHDEVEMRKKTESELRNKNYDLRIAYEQLSSVEEELRENLEEIRIRENQVINSERKLQDLVELLPQAIFEMDLSGIITSLNRVGLETFGVTRDDLKTGLAVQDFIGEIYRDKSLKFFKEVYNGARPGGIEYIARRKDGTLFPAVIYSNAIIENDKPVGIRGIVVDITELNRAKEDLLKRNEDLTAANEELMATEESLKRNYEELFQTGQKLLASESNFRAVLENSIVALYKRNLKTDTYDYISPVITEITGYPYEIVKDMSGDEVSNMLSPDDAKRIKKHLETLLAGGGGSYDFEYRILNKSGRYTWAGEIGRIYVDDERKSIYAIGSVQDINDRKIAEEGLSKANRKLNFLNSTVFTDIRNAIFSLSGYIQIERDFTNDEKILGFIDTQTRIIENIGESMKFAQIFQNLGIKPPERQKVIQMFLFGISHLDMSSYSRDLQVEGLEIFADPLLEHVFFSLADNVIQHSIHASMIRLWYKENDDELIIFFEDNGRGIPDSMKTSIFDRSVENKKGFGLFLSKEILSITNIDIVETGEFGKGARFELHVPKESYWIS